MKLFSQRPLPHHKTRVLVMGHTDGQGGAQTAFRELFNFIRREGYDVKLIALTDNITREQPYDADHLLGRIAHEGKPGILHIRKIFGLAWAAFRARRFKPDIFICVGLNNSSNLIARFAGDQCFKIGQDFIAGRSGEDAIWKSAGKALDGIALQAPSMLEWWKKSRIGINGINWLPCFPGPPVAGIRRSNDPRTNPEIRLAYFGRLAGNKGLSLLFGALASKNSLPHISLDIWGRGEEEDALKNLSAQLGLNSRVRFLGAYPGKEEGARLMASYDALVLCSTTMEGLPLVLLEAMAYGLPVLATDVGAIHDCCADNPDAILVEPNQEAIAYGLETLAQRITSGDFDSTRISNFYKTHFSPEVMEARWRTCLQNPTLFFNESTQDPAHHRSIRISGHLARKGSV
jgi:glycosyltransferase involved in cell wall biosynthesis